MTEKFIENETLELKFERKPKNKKIGKPKTPKFGSCKGMFEMSPDFDEPLEDFKDYMRKGKARDFPGNRKNK